MQLGIFAKIFDRPTLAENLDAMVGHGLHFTQFNLACAGAPSMPAEIDALLIAQIRQGFAARSLTMAAISGTYNMIHPDPVERAQGLRNLAALAAACRPLGTSVITLCTGTRDRDYMWRHHPDNAAPDAWRDLLAVMEAAVVIAEQYHVTLAFEPEPANVVDRPARARRLLDELASPRLKVVLDAANLIHPGELPRQAELLDEAFELLGDDIALAHAKDLDRDGQAGTIAAGCGYLDYDRYLALLQASGYEGPLIMHSLAESDVPGSVAILQTKLARLGN